MSVEKIYNDLIELFQDKPYIKIARNKQTIFITVEFTRFQHIYPTIYRKNKRDYVHTVTINSDNSYTLLDFINGDKVNLLDRFKRKHIGDMYIEGYRYPDPTQKRLESARWNNLEIKKRVVKYMKDAGYKYQPDKWSIYLNKFEEFKSKLKAFNKPNAIEENEIPEKESKEKEQIEKDLNNHILPAIQEYMHKHFSAKKFNGYIGKISSDKCNLISDAKREKKNKILNNDVYLVAEEENAIYLRRTLEDELTKLKLTDFKVYYNFQIEYKEHIQDTFPRVKYEATENEFYIIHLDLYW